MTQVPTRTLGDGTTLPATGFGTYPLTGEDGIRAIVSALEAGYRLLDTAVNYGNEAEVGEAIRRSGVPRDEIVVQTKVPGRDHAYDRAIASVEGSLERLGLEQVDVAVIHWPNPSVGLYGDAYRALLECRERGLVRSVGVSNFTEQHLADVIEATGVTPVLNQVELHPLFPQERLRAVHERLGIVTEAWSPLAQGAVLDDPVFVELAETHGKTPAQVVLRWHIQLGNVVFPKSLTPERIEQNIDVFDFELSEDDLARIEALDRGERTGPDPDTFNG